MIFPVMRVGGLTPEAGSGAAQVLKLRRIHATVRNLVLRGRLPQALPPGPQAMHQGRCRH